MRFRSCATLGAYREQRREWIGPGLIGARKHPFLTCSLVPASFPEQVAAAPHPLFLSSRLAPGVPSTVNASARVIAEDVEMGLWVR